MRDIRPVTEDELPEFYRHAASQLGLPMSMFGGMSPDWTLAAFEDGQIATTYAFWPLQIRFNGPPIPIAGVAMVSTHPSYRRQGNLRAITKQHFEGMHERGEMAWAGLHPALMAIYGRYGYGTVNIRHAYTAPPPPAVHPLRARGRSAG